MTDSLPRHPADCFSSMKLWSAQPRGSKVERVVKLMSDGQSPKYTPRRNVNRSQCDAVP